jgi:hypothetical protein
MDDWQDQAAAYLRRAYQLDSGTAGTPEHLLELAAHRGDTAQVRAMGARYLALDSTGDLADFIRWRVAQALSDSAALGALRSRFETLGSSTLRRIFGLAPVEGIGLDDAERARAILAARRELNHWDASAYELNRGRPRAAQTVLEAAVRHLPHDEGEGREVERGPIWAALYWDGDTAAAAAAATRIGRVADGPPARDLDARWRQYGDICVVETWRLARGDLRTVDRSIATLRAAVATRTSDSIIDLDYAHRCAMALGALAAGARRTPGSTALQQYDSVMRARPPYLEHGNLILAQLFEAAGDTRAALRAVRRRGFHYIWGPLFLSTFLREEGRLAALTGDRESAIRAYRHYLALRTDPEPELRAEVDRVRAELARLLGEQSQRP